MGNSRSQRQFGIRFRFYLLSRLGLALCIWPSSLRPYPATEAEANCYAAPENPKISTQDSISLFSPIPVRLRPCTCCAFPAKVGRARTISAEWG
jgi:hypothetical protein